MTIVDDEDSLGVPYPGLRSFQRDETHIFFGRESTINEMVDRLAAHRFLAVTGISGSGKSSLVRTGLLDALDRGLLAEAGSDWRVADFRPGAQPFFALVESLAKEVKSYGSDAEMALVEAKLARGPMGLVEWLAEIKFPPDANLLLLVDQFEEIFRYRQGAEGDDTNAFVALLVASAKQKKVPIYVVITMRSDFLGDCAQFTDLAETINDGQFLTPRLTREQCRAAIEGPAAVYGGRVEPILVTRMLNDMGGNPDQLPLMQHILMLLWHKASERAGVDGRPELTLADYEALGGIGTEPDAVTLQPLEGAAGASNGALSDHADQVLAHLSPEQQRLAETMFRALTESEGTGGRDTRRPISLAKIAAIADAPTDAVVPVVEAFRAPGVNFVTPPATIPLRPGAVIDISHESLIRQWVKLRQWVREEFQSAETYRDIEKSAKRWKSGLGNLLARLDLAVARKWRKNEHPNDAWATRYGDAFTLAMEFLRKSERNRLLRRGIAAVVASLVIFVVLSTTTLALYLTTIVTSGLSYVNPSDEWSNFGVPPQDELKKDVATNTPLSIPSGRVIGTAALEAAIDRGTLEGVPFILIDALRSQPHDITIPRSVVIAYAGDYGTFEDDTQKKLKDELAGLTKGNNNMPLVFYCYGSKCWESYNAALRAIKAGYTKVYWYRGGLSSWAVAHRPYPLDFSRMPVSWSGALKSGFGTIKELVWPDPDYHYKRGLEYASKEQFDDAIEDFTRAIALNPRHANAYEQRGRAYLDKGDLEDAVADLNKSIEIDPTRADKVKELLSKPKYAGAYANRGNALMGKNDYEGAIKAYDQAILLDPKFAIAYASRGYAYYRKEDNERALKDFDTAIMLDPKYAIAYNGRGNVYLDKHEYDLAIKDFDQAIALDPKYTVAYNGRGRAHYAKGDYDLAIKDYDQAVILDAEFTYAIYNRGNAHSAKGEYDLAIKDFDQAIKLAPKYAPSYNDRGVVYYNRGDYDAAIKDYSQAIELDLKFTIAYNNRGYAFYYKNDYDAAIKDFDQAIILDPKYASAYNGRGNAYSSKREYDRAIKEFDLAIESDPKYATAYNNRGNAHYSKNEIDLAIKDYDRAIEIDPKFASAYNNRGRAYSAQNKYDRAIKDYDRAIEINPKYADAYNNRGYAYYQKGDYERAIKEYSQAISLDSSFALAYNNRGYSYFSIGEYDNAISDYNDAIAFDPKYARAFVNRANAYAAKRNYEQATKDYERGIQLDPNDADAFWTYGMAEIYSDKAASATGHIANAVKLNATNSYYAFWLHIARIRAGQNDQEEFAANAKNFDRAKWPGPIFSLFLGAATPKTVRTAAEATNNSKLKNEQVCEADFYSGVYQLQRKDRNEARRLFQSAADNCPLAFIERDAAKRELEIFR